MRKYNKYILQIIFVILLSGCFMFTYTITENISHRYFQKKLKKEFLPKIDTNKIVYKGDVSTYKALLDSVRNDPRVAYGNSSFIDYSLIMAHYYDYAPANYDVYTALVSVFGKEDTDSNTMKMALFYLERGARKGDIPCIDKLKEINE